MRKITILFFILIPFICTSSANNLDIIESRDINLIIDSKKISLSTPILLSNSHILFPLREFCDNLSDLDINLFWDDVGQNVKIFYNDKTLLLSLNSNIAKINNTEVMLPCTPMLYKNKTYIPLRMLSEFLDYFIIWDDKTKTVFIKDSKNYTETKNFFDNLNKTVSNVYAVQIDIINEINDMSFGNSIYIDVKENIIKEKNIFNTDWYDSTIKLSKKTTLDEINYISTLACGMNINKKLSNENYYVYEGFFPSESRKLSKGKLYIDTTNLYLIKIISETETDLGNLKQNVLFSYGKCLI